MEWAKIYSAQQTYSSHNKQENSPQELNSTWTPPETEKGRKGKARAPFILSVRVWGMGGTREPAGAAALAGSQLGTAFVSGWPGILSRETWKPVDSNSTFISTRNCTASLLDSAGHTGPGLRRDLVNCILQVGRVKQESCFSWKVLQIPNNRAASLEILWHKIRATWWFL